MEFVELAKDTRQAVNSTGGSVPEDTMGRLVNKIANRLLFNKRDKIRKKRWAKLKVAGKIAAGAIFKLRPDEEPEAGASRRTEKESKLILSATRRIAAWAKRVDKPVEDIFQMIDNDGNGSIDYDEVRSWRGLH